MLTATALTPRTVSKFSVRGLRQRLLMVPPGPIVAEAAAEAESILNLNDLVLYARAVADYFQYRAERVLWHPVSFYVESIEHCTPEQATIIRFRALELCRDVTLQQRYLRKMNRTVRKSERAERRRVLQVRLERWRLGWVLGWVQALVDRPRKQRRELTAAEATERKQRRSDHLDGISLVFCLLWLFVIVGLLIGYHDAPTAEELSAPAPALYHLERSAR